MRRAWAILAAMMLAACRDQKADYDRQCMERAHRFRASDYVNQDTGRLDRDPTTNEILDPYNHRVAVPRSEERCIERGLQLIIGRYEGNGSADNGTIGGTENGGPGNAM